MDVLSLEVPLGPILGEGAAAVGLFIVAQEQEVAGGPRIRMWYDWTSILGDSGGLVCLNLLSCSRLVWKYW